VSSQYEITGDIKLVIIEMVIYVVFQLEKKA